MKYCHARILAFVLFGNCHLRRITVFEDLIDRNSITYKVNHTLAVLNDFKSWLFRNHPLSLTLFIGFLSLLVYKIKNNQLALSDFRALLPGNNKTPSKRLYDYID